MLKSKSRFVAVHGRDHIDECKPAFIVGPIIVMIVLRFHTVRFNVVHVCGPTQKNSSGSGTIKSRRRDGISQYIQLIFDPHDISFIRVYR